MSNGYVYLICDPGKDKFKIGVTRGSIESRMKKLQTGNSSELFITDYYKSQYPFRLEKMLHNHFHDKNVFLEWFELTKSEVTNFRTTCQNLENLIVSLSSNPFFAKNLH